MPTPGATERGLATMRKSLEKLAEKGGADPDEVLARVTPVEEIVPAALMIEAVVEDLDMKAEVFRQADETLPAQRGARLEHVLDPDHVARRRSPPGRTA